MDSTPREERAAITQGFFRGVVTFPGVDVLEELVGGGHDVLDLRTGLRLQNRHRMDQDVRVGQQLPGLGQRRQGSPGFHRGLEDDLGLKIEPPRRQRRKVIEGSPGTPDHLSSLSTHPANVLKNPGKLNTFSGCVRSAHLLRVHRRPASAGSPRINSPPQAGCRTPPTARPTFS